MVDHSEAHRIAETAHMSPSPLTNAMYWGARGTLRQIYRSWPLSDRGIKSLAAVERAFTKLPNTLPVRFTPRALGEVPVEVVTPTDADDVIDDCAVLYLHGGGFLFCGTATHRRICSRLAVNTGASVYSVRYRQLPDFGAGAGAEDAYAAYTALRAELPADVRIVVAGDSAGGFLAAKVCELSAIDGVRGPDALVGYSPLLDLEAPTSEGPWTTRDAFQPAATITRAQRLWDRGPTALRGSAVLQTVDPACFPPTFLTASVDEHLDSAILELTESISAAGGEVETHRWLRAVHAFPVLDALTRESREASELTNAFLRRVLGGR
ncbi:alpha/beta hydrolase [Gordonia zhaorongruii]|uniref:alpha/beta hydrolase n=1 Tax=Gordonia zhaorongruii TaxID=2597659 RepID=UPI0010525418|nr:alpha/beta hydrolase [Gordonia zhaorongruii]